MPPDHRNKLDGREGWEARPHPSTKLMAWTAAYETGADPIAMCMEALRSCFLTYLCDVDGSLPRGT